MDVWLSAKRENLSDISIGLIPLAIILGMFGGLILIQPDFSAVITILLLGGLMFFLAGGDLKQILILMVIALLVGWALVQLSPTGAERIDHFVGLGQVSVKLRQNLQAFRFRPLIAFLLLSEKKRVLLGQLLSFVCLLS